MENGVALVLEGGGLRGIFTAGVIDCFLDNNIEFDFVIGVSAGACNTFAYLGRSRSFIKKSMVQYKARDRFYGLGSMIENRKIVDLDKVFYDYTRIYGFDDETFISNPTKWEMVTTNIQSGQAEYMYSKDLERAKIIGKASCSLPLITDPVEIDGQLYMDGGMSDSIPLKRAYDLGYKKAIVVLTRKKGHYSIVSDFQNKLSKVLYADYPNFIETTKRRTKLYKEQVDFVEEEEKKGNVIIIRPSIDEVGRLESDEEELNMAYYHAYTKTSMNMDKIKKFMEVDYDK